MSKQYVEEFIKQMDILKQQQDDIAIKIQELKDEIFNNLVKDSSLKIDEVFKDARGDLFWISGFKLDYRCTGLYVMCNKIKKDGTKGMQSYNQHLSEDSIINNCTKVN